MCFKYYSADEAVFLADRIFVMTARPGKIKEIVKVPLKRERNRTSPEFSAIRSEILAMLEAPAFPPRNKFRGIRVCRKLAFVSFYRYIVLSGLCVICLYPNYHQTYSPRRYMHNARIQLPHGACRIRLTTMKRNFNR